MANARRMVTAALLVLATFGAACGDPEARKVESARRPLLAEAFERGDLVVEDISMSLQPEQTVYGRIIDITIRNKSARPTEVVIEPGTLLRSDADRVTDLVVTSRESATIEPGQSWKHSLEVFSVSFKKFSVTRGVTYKIGNLMTGDAYAFVTCFSGRRPDAAPPASPNEKPFDLTPVQLALWRITENMDRPALLASTSANPILKGGDFARNRNYFDGQAKYVQGLLDGCGLGQYKF